MFNLFRRKPRTPADPAQEAIQQNVMRLIRETSQSGTPTLDLSRVSLYELTHLPAEIGTLRQVSTLSLSNAGISSVAPISGLNQLKALDLSYCRNLSDLSPLSEITQLDDLDLSKTGVTNIEPLQPLKNLRSLDLQGCKLSDLSPLAELPRLETLNLANSQVSDLTALAGLTSLKSLNLWNTQIQDFTPLATLSGLKRLDLWNTQITDLSALVGLTTLTHLNLSHTKIKDLTPIRDLPNLRHLTLWNTPFQAEGVATGKYQGRWYDDGLNSDAADGDVQAVKSRVARGAMIMGDQWDGPIHWAIRNGQIEVCRFLISLEPSIVNDPACYDGVHEAETPLSLAMDHQQPEIVELLLQHGAKISPDEHGSVF